MTVSSRMRRWRGIVPSKRHSGRTPQGSGMQFAHGARMTSHSISAAKTRLHKMNRGGSGGVIMMPNRKNDNHKEITPRQISFFQSSAKITAANDLR